jgi:signal transduction histidine kinase
VSQPESVLVSDLLSTCLRALERTLSGRSVGIVRQIDRTVPPIVVDREALRRVIDTLLIEAASSTPEGGRIRVCLKHSSAAIMFSVKDGGPGMSEEAREALLADLSRPPREGAALSLAGCRETIASLGGNLFANSLPGKGSTYYVTFPPPLPP